MSIYTDFDASYGNYYSGLPISNVDTIDIFNEGRIMDNVQMNDSGVIDGNVVFEASNIDGGTDTFVNGSKISHTQPNVYGGEDAYEGTEKAHTTIPNEHGGYDIYDNDFRHEGTTFANVYGSEDYLSNEGTVSEISLYEDPLRHAQEVKFPSFNMT